MATKTTLAAIAAEIIPTFDAKEYVKRKLTLINNFFREEGLNGCVIGVSGGIDSATCVTLLNAAALLPDSPIKHIWAVSVSAKGHGVSGQDEARWLASQTVFGLAQVTFLPINIEDGVKELIKGKQATQWEVGQLIPMLRTSLFYFEAARLQSAGCKSIVVGTINKSEGEYLGYFGKGSDAMVDLQLISELHKSQVYKVARELKVKPAESYQRAPAGDVWDGRTDEQMICAPYWFIELRSYMKKSFEYKNFNPWDRLPINEAEKYCKWDAAIEMHHAKNEHKYRVGYPSHSVPVNLDLVTSRDE